MRFRTDSLSRLVYVRVEALPLRVEGLRVSVRKGAIVWSTTMIALSTFVVDSDGGKLIHSGGATQGVHR